jgi:hypothetical protein
MPTSPRQVAFFAELWDSGTDLDSAWLIHSATVEPFDLMALRTHPNNDDGIRGNPRYEILGDWLPPTSELRQEKLKYTIEELRHQLLGLLYEGSLWAIGCRSIGEGIDLKVLMPREYFFYPREDCKAAKTIDWKNGELRVESRHYFEIRVVVPPAVSEMAWEAITSETTRFA